MYLHMMMQTTENYIQRRGKMLSLARRIENIESQGKEYLEGGNFSAFLTMYLKNKTKTNKQNSTTGSNNQNNNSHTILKDV